MQDDLILSLRKAKPADEGISSFSEVIGNVPTPWEKGDVITFPDTIKGNAFKTKIGARKYEYIVVHVKSADGSERHANFSPSLFRKRARKYDWNTVDGVDVDIPINDFVIAGGNIVTEIYNKSRKINDVVTAVLGKCIRISEVHEVWSQEFGSTNPVLAKVYDFEPEGWTIGDTPEDATTDSDAIKKAENTYGNLIDEGLKNRDYSIYVVNGKMGLAHKFNLITQPKYDVIYPFIGEYAIVKIGNKRGLIDSKGREVMPVQYEYLYRLGGKVFWYDCNGMGYYNDLERQIFNQKCKYIEYMNSISNILHIEIDRILLDGWDEDNERFGLGSFLIDKKQRIVYSEKLKNIILPNYNIESFDFETDIFIISKNGKYGIANSYGKILAPLQYDRIEWSNSGMFLATIGNKEGFIDAYGNVKIAFNYDLVGDFCKGLTWVVLNGQSGVIDSYGRQVVPMGDYSIHILENGIIVMIIKHLFETKYAVYGWPPINLQKSYHEFNFNFNQNPNYVRVRCGCEYGVIKLNGEVVLDTIYDFIDFNIGNHIIVKENKKYGIMDLNGRTILPITYDGISRYGCEGNRPENIFYRVRLENKIGLMNQRMQVVIPILYDDIRYDSEYNANIVEIGNEYGMVDFDYNILIPFSKNRL
ncbi:MAG: WG repeat-containing protein [Bacteroidaceae bacterium]|nr:WG repeat-containing protein [Bacteroidaceae bacterium]